MSENSPTTGPSARNVLVVILLLVLIVWAQYVLWFGEQGIVRWRQTVQQLEATEKEVEKVSARIEKRKREILLVEKESTILEEVARRNLGLVHPDEIIFVFPSSIETAVEVEKTEPAQETPLQSAEN
uniref:Putative Cell division protein FtsB (FtsB) n=1 Tax=Magnetococcus massalia (strain MO-1) TaxID=451514 RepID=A0A1S7LNJ4_MAGMO|nr:putative Cell division protein FtsB (ftsB) [Candidatus Magnetococcus massalia]